MIRDVSCYRRTEFCGSTSICIYIVYGFTFRELTPSPRIQQIISSPWHMQLFMFFVSISGWTEIFQLLPRITALFCVHCICCKNSSASVNVICEELPRWDRRSWGQDHVGPAVADTTISAIWQIESGYIWLLKKLPHFERHHLFFWKNAQVDGRFSQKGRYT